MNSISSGASVAAREATQSFSSASAKAMLVGLLLSSVATPAFAQIVPGTTNPPQEGTVNQPVGTTTPPSPE